MESSDVGGDWEESAGGRGPGKSSGFPSPEGQLLISFSQVVFAILKCHKTNSRLHAHRVFTGGLCNLFNLYTYTGLINHVDS